MKAKSIIILLISILSANLGLSQDVELNSVLEKVERRIVEKTITFQYELTREFGLGRLMKDSVNTQKINLLYESMIEDRNLRLYAVMYDDFNNVYYRVSGIDIIYMGAKQILTSLLRKGINPNRIDGLSGDNRRQLIEEEMITEEKRLKNRRIECVLYSEE